MDTVYVLGAELIAPAISSFNQLEQRMINPLNGLHNSLDVVDDTILRDYLSKRYIKKIDKSVQLAIYAIEALLRKVLLSEIGLRKTGLCFGNNYAGWSYVEEQLYALYAGDPYAINPYVATAWFPAAAQGELSIRNQLFGHSKTFAVDQLSSAIALEYGIDLLRNKKLEYVIFGGHESLLSPIITTALTGDSLVGPGYPPSEAAVGIMLTCQAIEHVRAKARIPLILKASNLQDALIEMQHTYHEPIDYCILPPLNISEVNNRILLKQEIAILKDLFLKSRSTHKTLLGMPTYCFGQVSGASFALQVAVALWMLENQKIPCHFLPDLLNAENFERLEQQILGQAKPGKVNTILVIGRDYYAEQYVLLLVELNQTALPN